MATHGGGDAGGVEGWRRQGREDSRGGGGGGDVEAGGEGAGAGAREDDGADGGGAGEVGEEGAELEPHAPGGLAGREGGGGKGGARLDEGVESVRAVDFHMGDVFEGVGDLEVGVEGGAGWSSHLVARWRRRGRRGGHGLCKWCRFLDVEKMIRSEAKAVIARSKI